MPDFFRVTFATAVAALVILAPASGASAQILSGTEYSDASIVTATSSFTPGTTARAGLLIRMDEGWHTYWKNPGDSGSGAILDWNLPDGWVAGDFDWPFPERIEYPPLMSYAYEDEVLLPFDLDVPADAVPGSTVRLAANADWLVCEEVCLFAVDSLFLEVPVTAGEDAPSEWAGTFDETEWAIPVEAEGWSIQARVAPDGEVLGVGVIPAEDWAGTLSDAYFFPADTFLVDHVEPQPVVSRSDTSWIRLVRSPFSDGIPERLSGALVLAEGQSFGPDARRAVAVDALLEEGPIPSPPPVMADGAAASGQLSLLAALGLAALGGLLLNLMPCVFPVLSLKVLGFVEHAGEDRATLRMHGYVFAAGVILSFLALAGTLIAIRAAGAEVGWGFQLQNPAVVTALIFLMVAVALNFLGVFEVGNALTRLGAVGADEAGYRGSFLTGVLATLVATPCTAPFMGAAVAAALVRPPVEGLVIFGGLGAGMALPYVLLTMRPTLLERLPRPGRWMETLRQALAFPMLAVAVWLLWVLGLQVGMGGAAAVLTALLVFSLGAWILHRTPPASVASAGQRYARVGGVVLLMFSLGWGIGRFVQPAGAGDAIVVTWEPFTASVVAERRAEGRAVFVDFTAAWCITCQVNKRVALTDDAVAAAFVDQNVALVQADWTRRDDTIARELEALGRNGVPVYALYPADPSAPPQLLPNLLTPRIVLDALESVAGPSSGGSEPASTQDD
jgi:thiol:disulfide interchange protein DsbD